MDVHEEYKQMKARLALKEHELYLKRLRKDYNAARSSAEKRAIMHAIEAEMRRYELYCLIYDAREEYGIFFYA